MHVADMLSRAYLPETDNTDHEEIVNMASFLPI